MTNANHSPAPSAACNDNSTHNVKKPLRPFPMSSTTHSPATSAVRNGEALGKGKEPAWGSPFDGANEAGPSVIRGSNSIRISPQCSYSDVVRQSCPILNHNYNDDINDVFQNGKRSLPSTNVSSLGFPNGSSTNHSPANSAVRNGEVSDKGKESAWGSPFDGANEAGLSVIGGSNSIRMSPQCSYSDIVRQSCPILNHNYNDGINDVFQNGKPSLPSTNVSSLGFPNGSSTNHSPATSAVRNGEVSDKGKEPAWGSPFDGVNEVGPSIIGGSNSIRMSPQCSYSDVVRQSCPIMNHNYNDDMNDVFLNGKPSLPSTNVSSLDFPNWSSTNHSPATSVVRNGEVSDKGKEPAWGSSFDEANEAGPSVIGVSNSIRMSPQCSYSDVVRQSCPILNHNYNDGINDIFRNGKSSLPSANVSSLGFPNGSRSYYSGENGYRYDQGCYHEMMTNSYQGLRRMAPHVRQPPEQLRPFSLPFTSPSMCLVSFNGNYVPSFWPTFQGPLNLSYAPFDMYRYPIHPQAQYFSGPSYVVPQPQQSKFSSSIDDLRARLRKQIEYYFCSKNLHTDYYLKGLMDGCGWVSITLIMKFRKVVGLLKEKDTTLQSANIVDVLQVKDRSLSNDQQFVLDSLRPSNSVEVQSDRVRKRHNWEKWVNTPINKIK